MSVILHDVSLAYSLALFLRLLYFRLACQMPMQEPPNTENSWNTLAEPLSARTHMCTCSTETASIAHRQRILYDRAVQWLLLLSFDTLASSSPMKMNEKIVTNGFKMNGHHIEATNSTFGDFGVCHRFIFSSPFFTRLSSSECGVVFVSGLASPFTLTQSSTSTYVHFSFSSEHPTSARPEKE